MEKIPFINIEAKNNYDLGYQIGKILKNQIRKRLASNKKIYREIKDVDFKELERTALNFLPETMKFFPVLVEEAQGMSDGAEIKLTELMVLICEEELLEFKMNKCTSIAIKNEKEILLGHNEDWLKEYRTNGLYVLKCKINDISFLSLNYIGTLPGSSCGLNSFGFCFTGNSIGSGKFRYGIPKNFQMRAILTSKSVRDAVREDLFESSINSNTIYASKDLKILDVEDFFNHDNFFYGKDFLIHTNHPLIKKEQNEENTEKESLERYQRVKKFLEKEKNKNLDGLRKILKEHRTGICGHDNKKHSNFGVTIASIIMNPKEKWMDVAWANPCKHKYERYVL
ncbi:MAG: C45 family peptidase [Candidatus Paceibacterota bacterium]